MCKWATSEENFLFAAQWTLESKLRRSPSWKNLSFLQIWSRKFLKFKLFMLSIKFFEDHQLYILHFSEPKNSYRTNKNLLYHNAQRPRKFGKKEVIEFPIFPVRTFLESMATDAGRKRKQLWLTSIWSISPKWRIALVNFSWPIISFVFSYTSV